MVEKTLVRIRLLIDRAFSRWRAMSQLLDGLPRVAMRMLLRIRLFIGGQFRSALPLLLAILLGFAAALFIRAPNHRSIQLCEYPGFDFLLAAFCTMVATLSGGVLVVLVYQHTALRPSLLDEFEKSKPQTHLLSEMSNFVFLLGLCIFAFYGFSIVTALSVLIFQGINRGSFVAMCVAFPVVFFGTISCLELRKYWMCHQSLSAKVGVLAFAATTAMSNYAIFFMPTHINPFAVLLGLSALSVIATTLSLLTNLSYPFVIALDSYLYKEEVGRLNKLLTEGSHTRLRASTRRKLSSIRNYWYLLDSSRGHPKSHINLDKLREHIKQLEQIVKDAKSAEEGNPRR